MSTIPRGRNRHSEVFPKRIVRLRNKCKRLSKCKYSRPAGMRIWRTAQNQLMLTIQKFTNHKETNILESGESSKLYRYVNQRRVFKEGVAPLLDNLDEITVSNNKKAEILNAQFSSVFTEDDGTLPDIDKRTEAELSDINLSPELVRKFMCKLPNKFSSSPDGIPSAVLMCLSHELCTPKYILFRKSLECGECPSLWKSADVVLVYKKVDASLSSNYRPISTAICRLFERILADNNYKLSSTHKSCDHGFVKGHF